MERRKRARKKYMRDYINRRRAEKKKPPKNLEVNGPSSTSLSFSFDDHNCSEYKSRQTFFEDSIYYKKTIKLYNEWKNQHSWHSLSAEKRKANLLCTVANLLLLQRTNIGKEVRQPISLRVTSDIYLTEAIKFLRREAYINFLPGYSYGKGHSVTSKIYPTIKFDTAFPPFSDEYEANLHITFPDSELIRINRDGSRGTLSNNNRRLTEGIKNKLIKINRVNLSHKIVIRKNNVEYPCCTKLCAVFNENINRGGRLYATGLSYQNDLRENRDSIFIDDEPTIELDYSGLHPRMLYAEKGIQVENDLYDLTDVFAEFALDPELRMLSKLALMILINSKDDKTIPGTLAHEVWNRHSSLRHHLSKQYGTSKEGAGIYKRVVEAVIENHFEISEYFNSDAGARLQKKDGKMALWICYAFAEKGIPILPVHDSFVVAQKYRHLLREKMIESYAKFNFEFTCPIS